MAVLFVFASSVVKFTPPSVDTSIRYPVMAEPPLADGAVHDRLIRVLPLAVALSPVGMPGLVVRTTVELLTTAGTPPKPVVKVATSLPAASWRSTRGRREDGRVPVGHHDRLPLEDRAGGRQQRVTVF